MAHQSADLPDPPDATDPAPDTPADLALRAFVRARDRGDDAGKREAWGRLLELEMPRVRLILGGLRSEALDSPGKRIPVADREDVEQRVYLRLHDWLSLEGSSIGEARAIVRNATRFAFLDYVREHVADDVGREGSLDAADADGEGLSAFARRVEAQLDRGAADPIETRELRAAIDGAVLDLPEAQAVVVGLRLEGYRSKEIAERLELTPANVDQLYSRGRKRLMAALKDYR